MLVLSRKKNESLIIGDPDNPIARVTVIEIRGDKVRIGIEAEASISVHRKEIADEILAERNGR